VLAVDGILAFKNCRGASGPVDVLRDGEWSNSTIHGFCSRCGMPLDLKAALELGGARKKADDLMSRLLEDPEVQRVLKQKLAKLPISRSAESR